MDFEITGCFDGPPLHELAIIPVLTLMFALVAWRTVRRPQPQRWKIGRRGR